MLTIGIKRPLGVLLTAFTMMAGMSVAVSSPAQAYPQAPRCYDRPGPGGVDCRNQDYYNNVIHGMSKDPNTHPDAWGNTIRMRGTILAVYEPYIKHGFDTKGHAKASLNYVLGTGADTTYQWRSPRSRCFREVTAEFAYASVQAKQLRDNVRTSLRWGAQASQAGGAPGKIVSSYLNIAGAGTTTAYMKGMENVLRQSAYDLLQCSDDGRA